MKGRAQFAVLALVLVALAAGLMTLFRLRLGQGDIFPAYSSLRADPLGTRVLYDSLERVPGVQVERRVKKLTSLEPLPPRTLLLVGLVEQDWTHLTTQEFEALDGAVRAGSRLVLALRAESVEDADERKAMTDEDEDEADEPAGKKENGKRKPKVTYANLEKEWGVILQTRTLADGGTNAAVRAALSDPGLPASLPWRSDLIFRPQPGGTWRTIYRRAGESVLLERRRGLGSVVLAGDAYFLSNEALQRDRSVPLVLWTLGSNRQIVFEETHLGLASSPGIAALARRYGLGAAFFTLVLLALLFVWNRAALFVPPAEQSPDLALAYHPAAGLEALLRRSVAANDLESVCLTEWKRTASTEEVRRVETALASEKSRSVIDRYNAAVRALRRRRM
jgi:hypothetical protein